MIPYGRQSVNDDDIQAVADVLRGDWLTTGPMVDAFESAVAATASARHAIAVTSGTAALHVAYSALDLSENDEVITTPLTFVATAAAAFLAGAKVRFADVDPLTGNLDADAVASTLSRATRAVTTVDYAGVPSDVAALRAVVGPEVVVVQDAAHSVGSLRDGKPVGSEADLTTFSFFPTKNLTTGEGGAVVTNNDQLAVGCRRFKNHGLVRDKESLLEPDVGPWHQEVQSFGLNYRLPDVLAALGLSQLKRLAEFKQRRQHVFSYYTEALRDVDGLELPSTPSGTDPMWHLFPIRVEAAERRRIFEELRSQGIGVQVNYIPAYWHPVFRDLGYQKGLCPNAESYYAREISLPMFAGLTEPELAAVCDAVRSAVR